MTLTIIHKVIFKLINQIILIKGARATKTDQKMYISNGSYHKVLTIAKANSYRRKLFEKKNLFISSSNSEERMLFISG